MGRPNRGFPCMGKGLRVPLGDPCLDEIVEAIRRHSDCELQVDGDPIDLVRGYQKRDRELYEVASRLRPDLAKFWPNLLEAIDKHDRWRFLTHAFQGLEDLARQYRERDAKLYDCAAEVRLEAVNVYIGAGVYLEEEMLEAMLEGRKTIMRIPVEFCRTGKILPAHYKVNGGENGSYALFGPSQDGGGGPCRLFPSHCLKVLSVRMEDLGDATDAEARLEGLADRVSLLDSFWRRHGKFLSSWPVQRYELELIEL